MFRVRKTGGGDGDVPPFGYWDVGEIKVLDRVPLGPFEVVPDAKPNVVVTPVVPVTAPPVVDYVRRKREKEIIEEIDPHKEG